MYWKEYSFHNIFDFNLIKIICYVLMCFNIIKRI